MIAHVTAAALLCTACAGAGAEAPAPALAALRAQAGGAPLERVEPDQLGDVPVYEGAWLTGGVRLEATVTGDGVLVEREEPVEAAAVPAAVRAAARARLGDGARFVRKTWWVYEAQGPAGEVIFTPTGAQIPDLDGADDTDDAGDADDADDASPRGP